MSGTSFLRRIALAGTLALSMTGISAAVGGVDAMPMAPQIGSGTIVAVQYTYRHYRRHRRAGLYDCGRGGLRTHLSRRACGFTGPARSYLYRR